MERIIADPTGLKVEQQVVAITDAAGNVISNFGGPGAGTTFADQVVIVTSGTPVALPAHAMANSVIVKSLSTNNSGRQTTSVSATLSNATAGASGATAGYILEPGEAAPYAATASLNNTNLIYVNGYAGDVFSIIGS